MTKEAEVVVQKLHPKDFGPLPVYPGVGVEGKNMLLDRLLQEVGECVGTSWEHPDPEVDEKVNLWRIGATGFVRQHVFQGWMTDLTIVWPLQAFGQGGLRYLPKENLLAVEELSLLAAGGMTEEEKIFFANFKMNWNEGLFQLSGPE